MQRFSLALIACVMTVTAVAGETLQPPQGILTLSPYPAPTLQLKDIDGADYDLQNDRGAVVFVHFWASWCGPCRKEMPAIQRMAAQMEAEGLKIAVINTAEDEDTVFSFLASYAPDIRPLMDRDGLATEAWKPRGLPATYLVDRRGQVRYQALGGRPWDEADYMKFLRALVKTED